MIYFIQDKRTNAIKIGYTGGDPRDRMAALQTGTTAELVLLAAMPGDMGREAELHRRFASARMVGEWFHPCSDLLQFLFTTASETAYYAGYEHGFGTPDPELREHPWLRVESLSGSADQIGATAILHCPVCNFNYNHFAALPTAHRADADFDVELECENGHAWRLSFDFRKGHTLLSAHTAADRQPATDLRYGVTPVPASAVG